MTTETGLKVHEHLTACDWRGGKDAHALAYWTMRLAEELASSTRYDAARRALRELAWSNIRPHSSSENAVTRSYPALVTRFLSQHASRFNSKHEQSVREIRAAIAAMSQPAAIAA